MHNLHLVTDFVNFGKNISEIYWKVKRLQSNFALTDFETERKFFKFALRDLDFPILVDPKRLREVLSKAFREVDSLYIKREKSDYELENILVNQIFQMLGVNVSV